MFLDDWITYQDPTLPKFSNLTVLFFAILLSSFAIAFDLGSVLKRLGGASSRPAPINALAIIGERALGTELTLLCAEERINISLYIGGEKDLDSIAERVSKSGNRRLGIKKFREYKFLFASLPQPRLVLLCLPSGPTGHMILEAVLPHLAHDDVILDCGYQGNPNIDHGWRVKERGVKYFSCVIDSDPQGHVSWVDSDSSNYNSKKTDIVPDQVIKLLNRLSATDKDGRPALGVVVEEKTSGSHIEMVLREREA
ncbi:hypothetical protein K504DRAFT_532387 [Pleomassaria siparia CBS 279.74]|uniref:Uncharacterized protein n=1 Tax=Pleomassaria siparia CBS 279.74 TaxID=1314801 RepID=A0A6G1KH40_9PLEO|nr:hypothetical protein K504DRAFT_532387 [Pleomassaria siparia CBS 279.74]